MYFNDPSDNLSFDPELFAYDTSLLSVIENHPDWRPLLCFCLCKKSISCASASVCCLIHIV